MTRKKLILLIGFIVMVSAALGAQMSRRQMQDMYVSYLREEGYQPSVDSDGDVMFKAEGFTFYIIVDDEDPESFRILFANFWEIESDEEKANVYAAANLINRTTKVAKVYVNSQETNVSMDANIYVGEPEDFKLHFPRMIHLLLAEIVEFRDEMNK